MTYWKKTTCLLSALATILTGCGATQYEFDTTRHITKETVAEERPPEPSGVPDLIGSTAELPDLVYEGTTDVFDIVVENISVRQVFTTLADQAQLDLDIDPSVDGVVSLNAYGQTLDQIFERIRRQLPLRYERIGSTIVVMYDDLYYRQYHMSFPNLTRTYTASADGSAPSSGAASLGSSSITTSKAGSGSVWNDLEKALEVILENEYYKFKALGEIGPVGEDPISTQLAASASALAERNPKITQTPPFAHIIPDSELIIVYATSKQHKLIGEIISKMTETSRRQVLLQATVVEIQLSNNYQQGIDWSIFNQSTRGPRLVQSDSIQSGRVLFGQTTAALEAQKTRLSSLGLTDVQVNAALQTFAAQPPTVPSPSASGGFINSTFTVGDLDVAISLLDKFGDTKVVSSPRISALNGQAAILKVVEDTKYFTVQIETERDDSGVTTSTSTVEVETIPTGFVVNVYPQIGTDGTIILSMRPSVSRVVGTALPPSLAGETTTGIPIVSVKEIETLMLLRDGQTAVMGGLIEDQNFDSTTGVPGANKIPGIGGIFENKSQASKRVEYVIFVSAKIIRNPTLHGDYREYQDWLPSDETMHRDQSTSFFGNEVSKVQLAK